MATQVAAAAVAVPHCIRQTLTMLRHRRTPLGCIQQYLSIPVVGIPQSHGHPVPARPSIPSTPLARMAIRVAVAAPKFTQPGAIKAPRQRILRLRRIPLAVTLSSHILPGPFPASIPFTLPELAQLKRTIIPHRSPPDLPSLPRLTRRAELASLLCTQQPELLAMERRPRVTPRRLLPR